MKDETKLLIWFMVFFPSSRKVRKCQVDELQPSPFLEKG